MPLTIRALSHMALTILTCAVVTPILAIPIVAIGCFSDASPTAFRLSRAWARSISWSMGLSFSLEGTERIVPGTSYIVTPNHQGNADILALFQMLPMQFQWVIKKGLFKIPFFGWALYGMGAISLDRANREKSIQRLQDGSKLLKEGVSVVIYPEGTRSSDPHLQPFKKGAFMMAVQTGAPILPVTCNGAFRVLPRKTVTFRPGHVTVTLGDPIPTEGLTVQDVPELMEKTRAEILKHLDPDYDPFSPSHRGRT